MNTIRNFKYRNNVDISGVSPTSSKPAINANGKGVFNRLVKRYANVKILRPTPGRQTTDQPVSTGSYDMRGASGELKREIGAPILISKTCIDMDTTDCQTPDAWRQVGPSTGSTLTSVDLAKSMNVYGEGAPRRGQSPETTSTSFKQSRSKSANNLHRSEIKVYLHRAPSLTIDANDDHAEPITKSDLNKSLPQPNANVDALKSSVRPMDPPRSRDKFASRLSTASDAQSTRYSSKDSLNTNNMRHGESDRSFSHDSLTAHESSPERMVDDFQTSFQSLDARNIFQSIEQLNEITRKLNETEEFDQHIDLEYCEHRDKLRPDQRRITLLRVKSSGALGLDQKREKLGYAWKGLKHWLEEKEDKVKEVVHKHAAMQRVGGVVYDDVPIGHVHASRYDLDARGPRNARDTSVEDQDNGHMMVESWNGSTTSRLADTREVNLVTTKRVGNLK